MLSDPEPGVEGPDCLLWDGAGFDESSSLLTETIAPRDFAVVLFGAGHVGAALVRVLATLPCHVRWVDERDAQFPPRGNAAGGRTSRSIRTTRPTQPSMQAAPHTYFIVMTHNHALDLELAERILRRGDFAFFGMIGSHSKRKQFEHRLAARGIDPVADRADEVPARRGRHRRQVAGDHCDLGGRAGVAGGRSERPRSAGG